MLFDLNEIPSKTKPMEILHWERIKKIKAKEIESGKFDGFEELGWKMVQTCMLEDGIGLAAPQVGLFKKVMLCREMDGDGWDYKFRSEFRLYVNPNFEPRLDDGKWDMAEYCLSVPGKGYKITRWKTITAKWVEPNEKGEFVEKEKQLEGWAARLFQHEFDHLNGVSIPQRYQIQNEKNKKPQKGKRRK